MCGIAGIAGLNGLEAPEALVKRMTDRVAVFHAGRLRTVLETRATNQEEIMQHASGRLAAAAP